MKMASSRMDRWVGKIAVVTGASAGIGLAIAKALAREGMTVIGLARRKTKMEENMSKCQIGKGKFYGQECDVTSEVSVAEAFQQIETKFGELHVLINNAGIVRLNSLIDVDIKDIHDQFAVNVLGVIYCCREAVKLMKKCNQDAHIINMNSIQGHRVHVVEGLDFNAYAATKHAVTALTETLMKELIGGKIRVTSISPGVVQSEIFEGTSFDKSMYAHFPALEPEDVAETVVFAISRPHHVQITELTVRPLGETI